MKQTPIFGVSAVVTCTKWVRRVEVDGKLMGDLQTQTASGETIKSKMNRPAS